MELLYFIILLKLFIFLIIYLISTKKNYVTHIGYYETNKNHITTNCVQYDKNAPNYCFVSLCQMKKMFGKIKIVLNMQSKILHHLSNVIIIEPKS